MLVDAAKVLEWIKSNSPGFSLKDCVVDAVSVVRCKDCRWATGEDTIFHCVALHGLPMIMPDSFCSYGKRRDSDATD